MIKLFITGAFPGCLLLGCASLSPQARFGEIRGTVDNRIQQRVEWRGTTAADDAIDAEIQAMLNAPLTADSAVQIALLSNRALQATYEELGVAQADLAEAGLLRNPVFEAQYRVPGRPANPYELHVVQDFIDVFFIPLRRRIAGAELEAAKYRVGDAVLEHAAKTRQAFYRFQGAQQLVEMREAVVTATEASALLAQRQHEAGNISDLNVAHEQALYEQAKADLLLARTKAMEEREQLNDWLGLSSTESSMWSVGERLGDPLPDTDFSLSVEHLEATALAQRLDLQSARQTSEALVQSLGMARSSALVKSFDLGVHLEREPDGPATWGPSVGLPLPIFNQGRPAVARAAARVRQSQQEFLGLAAKIGAEVRRARHRMVMAAEVAEHYKSVMLPLREKIVSESQLHYNAMQIGPLQLLQAKQSQLEAGARYIEALETYWVASADLERAVGGRLGWAEAAPAQTTKSEDSPVNMEEPDHGGHR